jgi:hypothetical protein
MSDTIKTYTLTDVDSNGNNYVGSDRIIAVHGYRTESEAWKRDFSGDSNVFTNGDFTATTITGSAPGVPGTGWYETGDDHTNPADGTRIIKLSTLPSDFRDELLAKATVIDSSTTAHGNFADDIAGEYLVDGFQYRIGNTDNANRFPYSYSSGVSTTATPDIYMRRVWVTSSGTTNSGFVSWTLEEPTLVSSFYVDSYADNGYRATAQEVYDDSIGYYEIKVATSGTGMSDSDYSVVLSKTENDTSPTLQTLSSPTLAKHVKIAFKNKGGTKTTLGRVFAYTKEVVDKGISFLAHARKLNSSRQFFLNQVIDLTGVDTLYMDVSSFVLSNNVYPGVYIDDVLIDTVGKLPDRTLSGNDDNNMVLTHIGKSVDVSSFSGSKTFKIGKPKSSDSNNDLVLYLGNFTSLPPWFTEPSSPSRSGTRKFPNDVSVIVDSKGLSIIDSSDDTLWMRFDLGLLKMLERLPTCVRAKEGVIYFGTTNGFYGIDFILNKSTCLDLEGIRERYGINIRNKDAFDRANRLQDSRETYIKASYNINSYMRVSDSPSLTSTCVDDFYIGEDSTYGNFFIFATPQGLVVHKGALGSPSAELFYSLDEAKVHSVFSSGAGKIWYVQGVGESKRVKYIDNINSVLSTGFKESGMLGTVIEDSDSISTFLTEKWKQYQADSGMVLFYTGEHLTISGTHNIPGKTGIETAETYPDRSFVAKLKVRIKNFPPQAKGGFRFGYSFNHRANGALDGLSNFGTLNRQGVYLSAHNVDPFGSPVPESSTFVGNNFESNEGWMFVHQNVGYTAGTIGVSGQPVSVGYVSTSGINIYTEKFALTSTLPERGIPSRIARINQSRYFRKRDLSLRAQVKLAGGFTPLYSITNKNAAFFMGLSSELNVVPGTPGNRESGDNAIDVALLAAGNTTVSGISYYDVGYLDDEFLVAGTTFSGGSVQIDTSDYSEWRIEYSRYSNSIDGYIDGQYIGTSSFADTTSSGITGLVFGQSATSGASTDTPRDSIIKNVEVYYPEVNEYSSNRYGLETTDNFGIASPVFSRVNTCSGLALASDTVPASGTLTPSDALCDGDTTSSVISMAQYYSTGFFLPQPGYVDVIRFHDTASGTYGWHDSSSKNMQLWTSDDNISWALYKNFDLNNSVRSAGISEIQLSPSISGSYFKLHPTSSNYKVAGNTTWSISEIEPLMASGIPFYGNDGTSSADFREWKLTYDSATKEIVGSIDGVEISKGTAPEFGRPGKFVVSHDLSVVSSGTHSSFWADVKDFEVSFGDSSDLGVGTLNYARVSGPTISPTLEDYTFVSTTVSGLYILDRDFYAGSILSDRQLTLGPSSQLVGNFSDASISLFENGSSRGEGILLLGTNTSPSFGYEVIPSRPIWMDHTASTQSIENNSLHGNRVTHIYMPVRNEYFTILDEVVSYMLFTDLRSGKSTQIDRRSWIEQHDTGYGYHFHTSQVVADYVPRTGKLWHRAANLKLGSLDIDTSTVVVYNSPAEESILQNFDVSGNHFLTYSIHNHSVYYGQETLMAVDVLTAQNRVSLKDNSKTLDASSTSLNRGIDVPWSIPSSPQTGQITSTYCDFDRCVYFIGKSSWGWYRDAYFCRYHVDNDYFEVIGTFNENERDWPYSDNDSPALLVWPSYNRTARLVYCPLDTKIYYIANKGPSAELTAYDVSTQTWEYPGANPPYVGSKDWPIHGKPPISTSAHDTDTNFISYDIEEEALVFASGNFYNNTDKFFLYRPPVPSNNISFDYIPSIHGLPSASGISKHNTVGSAPFSSLDINSWRFTRDFPHLSSDSSPSDIGFSVYSESPEVTVLSGTTSSFNSAFGVEGAYSFYTTSKPLEAVGGFDVHFDFAMPSYSKNVYAASSRPTENPPRSEFTVFVADGWAAPWTHSALGQSDYTRQDISARMGVLGTTFGDATDYDLKAYLRHVDGFNDNYDTTGYEEGTRMYGRDTYTTSTVDFGSAFTEYKHGYFTYDYVTDTAQFFVDGVSAGSYKLRRKFNGYEGIHMGFGFSYQADGDSGKEFVVSLKNLKFSRCAWDRIEDGRLITSVSGSVGSYYHERWDSTLLSTRDWVYECTSYLPSSTRYSGYDYIATLGAVGDESKLVELVAFVGDANRKRVGIVGDLDRRDDRTTYLASVEHQWDDLSSGKYRIEKNTVSGTVNVYINDSVYPSMSVNYSDTPNYGNQHVYYGKVSYGAWEKIYTSPTTAGSWTSQFTLTGYATAQNVEKMSIDDTARFATISQGSAATASFDLDEGLGEVDVYAFFLSQGYDLAIDAPHIVTASGVVSLPTSGPGKVIASIQETTDENENYSEFKTLLKIDQTRDFEHTLSSTSSSQAQTSGWVYLGRYDNPTNVLVTASGTVGTASTIGFVSTDAIGIDIGKYGKSTFDMSVSRVRYNTGTTTFPADGSIDSGISVIDMTDGTVLAKLGETETIPLVDGDITDGSNIG